LKGKHALKFGGEFAHIEADAAIYVNARAYSISTAGELFQVRMRSPTSSPALHLTDNSSLATRKSN